MTASRRRTFVLLALFAVYLATALRGVVGELARRGRFDPFLPLARTVERRVEEGRFAEALPMAADLDRTYPREPQIAFWLARIHFGLHDTAREIDAWESYMRDSPAPGEACPALPEAYERAGRGDDGLRAYERCAGADPDSADRLIDLGDAYARRGEAAQAVAQFTRAKALDPDNPFIAARLAQQPETRR
jgi:tetratricopeptide (TPR) repeat protein